MKKKRIKQKLLRHDSTRRNMLLLCLLYTTLSNVLAQQVTDQPQIETQYKSYQSFEEFRNQQNNNENYSFLGKEQETPLKAPINGGDPIGGLPVKTELGFYWEEQSDMQSIHKGEEKLMNWKKKREQNDSGSNKK